LNGNLESNISYILRTYFEHMMNNVTLFVTFVTSGVSHRDRDLSRIWCCVAQWLRHIVRNMGKRAK